MNEYSIHGHTSSESSLLSRKIPAVVMVSACVTLRLISPTVALEVQLQLYPDSFWKHGSEQPSLHHTCFSHAPLKTWRHDWLFIQTNHKWNRLFYSFAAGINRHRWVSSNFLEVLIKSLVSFITSSMSLITLYVVWFSCFISFLPVFKASQ